MLPRPTALSTTRAVLLTLAAALSLAACGSKGQLVYPPRPVKPATAPATPASTPAARDDSKAPEAGPAVEPGTTAPTSAR